MPDLCDEFNSFVGIIVHKSTFCRMLARHGWRKIKPDTRHPHSDSVTKEEFKKKHSKFKWIKLRQTEIPNKFPICLMFQDEARLTVCQIQELVGLRMGCRPMVKSALLPRRIILIQTSHHKVKSIKK
ncbi:MAG: winged helix-turn-helix domain-containing protein [Deltaproteobacteria bacterium]|nr:winged helix-turn-helix domain-containing protein [Deltaproteobacteria bacterium]